MAASQTSVSRFARSSLVSASEFAVVNPVTQASFSA